MADVLECESTSSAVGAPPAPAPEVERYYADRRLLYRNVFWLVFGGAAAGMGVNTADSLMPLHMSNIGLDAERISLLMAIRGWYGPVLMFYIAWQSDHCQMKMGRRLPFVAGTLPFIAVGMFFFPYARTLLACLVLYSIFRIALDVMWDAYPYLIYDIARKEHWGRVSGINTTVRGIGVWVGQVAVMPLVPMIGEKAVYALATVLLVISSVVTVLFIREPPLRQPRPAGMGPIRAFKTILLDVWRVGFADRRNIVLFVACSLVVSAGLPGVGFVALQGKVNLGLSEGDVGRLILQWGSLLAIALAFAAGWLIDRIGAIRTIAIGCTGLITAAWIGYHPQTWKGLAAAYGIMYGSTCLTYTGAILFVVQGVDRKHIATFSSCNGAVILFMQSIYMMGAGTIVKRLAGGNYGAVFPYSLALLGIGLPLLWWIHRLRAREGTAGGAERAADA